MKKFITIALIITYILLLQVGIYAFSLNVEPTKLFFNSGSETKSVIVKNNGKENMSVSIYSRDWEYKGKGKVFLEAGKSKFSLYKWISVSPSVLELKPGEEKEVNITIKQSDSAKGGYVGVVFFETLIGTQNKGKVKIAGRIGTLVFLETQKGVIKKGSLTQIKTIETKDRKPEITMTFFNEGNSHIFSSGNVIITDYQGNVLDKIKFQDWGSLPGIESELTKKFSKQLLPGNYVLVATIDYGMGMPIVVDKSITIK